MSLSSSLFLKFKNWNINTVIEPTNLSKRYKPSRKPTGKFECRPRVYWISLSWVPSPFLKKICPQSADLIRSKEPGLAFTLMESEQKRRLLLEISNNERLGYHCASIVGILCKIQSPSWRTSGNLWIKTIWNLHRATRRFDRRRSRSCRWEELESMVHTVCPSLSWVLSSGPRIETNWADWSRSCWRSTCPSIYGFVGAFVFFLRLHSFVVVQVGQGFHQNNVASFQLVHGFVEHFQRIFLKLKAVNQ